MYLYTLKKDFKYTLPHGFRGRVNGMIRFYDDKFKKLAEISDFYITVYSGYSSDGCSPKIKLFNWVVGTPDGPIQDDGYPQTYWASLIHDVIWQFNEQSPFASLERDKLFLYMLKKSNWKYSNLYYYAVRLFSKITGI